MESAVPACRLGAPPDDVAEVVAGLLRMDHFTGEVITVDGGPRLLRGCGSAADGVPVVREGGE